MFQKQRFNPRALAGAAKNEQIAVKQSNKNNVSTLADGRTRPRR
jgi:hypothetical protein